MDDKNYKSILMKSPFGFAYHKIIVDEQGKPTDYEFLEVNPAFERITGLKAKEIIGKTVCEVLPGIREGNFDWVQYYGDIALDGGESEFEQYSKPLGSWYKVHAYSNQKYYFSTVFTDISAQKSLSDIATTFNNFTAQTIDMQYVADKAREISGATYAVLNKFDEKGRDFSTIAFSGMNKHIEKGISLLGFDPRGKKWDYDPERQKKIDKQKTTIFQQLTDLTGTTIPEKIITLLSKTFNIGQVAVVKTTSENTMLGDFVLFFKRGSQLQNRETLETYADLTGMLLSRIDEERKVINEKTRLKTITDNMTDLVWETDLQLKNIYLSPSVERILGFSVEEYMPLTIEKRCKPESLQTMLPLLQEELEKENDPHVSKSRSRLVELEYYKKDGSIIPMESNIGFVRDKNGKPIGLRGVSRDITERKQMEEVLKNNEALLNETSMTAKVGGWEINLLRETLAWTNETFRIHELDRTEQPNVEEAINYYHPDDRSMVNEAVQKSIKTGEPYNFEARLITALGNQKWVLSKGNSVIENGKAKIVHGIIQDITERKQAETELRKLSTAVQQSPSVIAITDTEGNLQFVNPKFTEITGYSVEEAIGQNPRVLKSGEQSDEMYKELWETVSAGKVWRGEFHNKKKNGELFWEMASVSPIFDEQGKIINYIKVAEDITERKRYEETRNLLLEISQMTTENITLHSFLAEVHQKIKKLIRADNFYVALHNAKDNTFTFPHHVDEYDQVELNKVYDFSGGFTDYVLQSNQALIITPEYQPEIEKDGVVKAYGNELSVWLGVPIKTQKGDKPNGVIAIQDYKNLESYTDTDKTIMEIISHNIGGFIERVKYTEELIQSKEKAEESNRLKTAFLNNMSHEIRTPLNGITGFIGLLQESEINDEEKQLYFDIINKSSDRLIATVTDIMDISRIEAGEVKVSKTEVSVNEILEEQYSFFNHQAQTKGLELIYKPGLSDKEARFVTDKHKLEGILTKLIKNAIKFTEEGEITFSCSLKKEKDIEVLEFYVKDTGIGIPSNRIEAIFNRFEQADIEDTRVYEGSGLGLAIAKSYVEMLGGEISVSSKEGSGSTFTFSLPYTKQLAKGSDAKGNINEETQTALSNLSVIIAEDDKTSKMFFDAIFKNTFSKITYTKTGKETIDLCRENPETDLILMDIKMPDINGYDATREIRKFNRDVIIIAQTAFGLTGDREKAIEAGCDDYITKPIKKDLLFEKIKSCMNK
ncbi:MAG: PAS domain S-box protein [Salinivirgaceae bacterium]|nr:PAS domain S-box protein [Salinivirgaceae bacterium]